MSSNAQMIPAEVLSHPAVASLIDRGTPTGRVTPEEVRRATEDAAVEPRHLKALLGHLSTLGITVDLGAATQSHAAAAATSTAKKKTATAKTAAKKADGDAEAPAPAKKAAAKKTGEEPANAEDREVVELDDIEIEVDLEVEVVEVEVVEVEVVEVEVVEVEVVEVEVVEAEVVEAEETDEAKVGTDGKKVLPDVSDEQFEKEAADPEIAEVEKESETFVVSAADDTDEPEQQVMVAGATADPVKDYLKQIGKVPLLNAEMEVELAKRIEAGLFAEEKLAKGGKIAAKLEEELEWIAEDGPSRQEPPARGQPAPRRLPRQALHRPRHARSST